MSIYENIGRVKTKHDEYSRECWVCKTKHDEYSREYWVCQN